MPIKFRRAPIALLVAMVAAPIAAPAIAEEPKSTKVSRTVAPQRSHTEKQIYCAKATLVGTQIMRNFCGTRKQWLVRGGDPLPINRWR